MSGSQAPAYIRPSKTEDWEPYREIIAELYRTKKLKEVMEDMESVYYFKATQVDLFPSLPFLPREGSISCGLD